MTQRPVRSMDVFFTDGDPATYLRPAAEHGRPGPWARAASSRRPDAPSADPVSMGHR